ncbi:MULTISPECIES: DUF4252 domain-containing protein [unclassified Kaistella]|uniref:DUF4252 domain-containing protein n=1 Tax=unclassified Kaistella TaxID=2762626 RepID=UPI0027363DE0|nr:MULTISPECIES: DUF4252 domain-containing protein [unclassified Kaistella]MDP2454278.1 DUF4252 domain-containing protein [Kaistella sp. SH11-4b]MDP2457651.1 DUF4252 domain-containing protein [Kaistella sp. SH40-3]MDP2460409.1 DUF4252 domain-containing protein [Kaistella sp. SH19-2b]
MKKLYFFFGFALLIVTMQSCIVSQKPKMGFFDNPYYDYGGAQFTSINVPMFLAKPIVKKALREDGESEELINLIKKISDVKVMTIENGNSEMVADFAKYLKKDNYEEWMTVKKEKETINFQAKQKGEEIRRLMITITSGSELVLVDVSGKFTADDISRLINYSEKNDLRKKVTH